MNDLAAAAERAKRSFLHGLILPFSLVVATVRDRDLRGPYLRITAARLAAVMLLSAFALATGSSGKRKDHGGPRIVVHHDIGPRTGASASEVHVHVPGVHVDIADGAGAPDEVTVLGRDVPVVDAGREPEKRSLVESPWAKLLAVLGVISAASGVVVALSRRYDDWLSFGASRLASITPEDPIAPSPRIAVDLRWLIKKVRRRIRGYIVFGAGVPALALLGLVPTIGEHLFHAALTGWAWYWLGVFTASKTAHAWADEGVAPSPRIIRELNERLAPRWWSLPLRGYARLWAWLTRGVNPPAAVFERTPAAFLGLALARAVLALPGLYLLARPIVPVAAGRLCAEGDPHGRFTTHAPAPIADEPLHVRAAA